MSSSPAPSSTGRSRSGVVGSKHKPESEPESEHTHTTAVVPSSTWTRTTRPAQLATLLCPRHGLLPDLAVEIITANVTLLTGPGLHFDDTYSATPMPGCSLGPAAPGSDSSGTMGPVFGLSLPGVQGPKKYLAVSCAHVLSPGK